jgi:hypothetical protein
MDSVIVSFQRPSENEVQLALLDEHIGDLLALIELIDRGSASLPAPRRAEANELAVSLRSILAGSASLREEITAPLPSQ